MPKAMNGILTMVRQNNTLPLTTLPIHLTKQANFRIRLIAVDSTSCNIRDTAYLTIHVS